MISVVPEDERPFQFCDAWVSGSVAMCRASAEAWEMIQEQVCALCELHNRTRELGLPVAKKADGTFVEEGAKVCAQCGEGTSKGRVLCHRCLFEKQRQRRFVRRNDKALGTAEERTCRFCGKENVASGKWRAKQQMCSDTACWRAFLEELNSQKVAI